MYEIYNVDNREVIGLTDEVTYVKRGKLGIWHRCKEDAAECILSDGIRYSIAGKTPVADAPVTADIKKADAAAALRKVALENISHAETLEEVKAAYTDLAEAVLDLYLNE